MLAPNPSAPFRWSENRAFGDAPLVRAAEEEEDLDDIDELEETVEPIEQIDDFDEDDFDDDFDDDFEEEFEEDDLGAEPGGVSDVEQDDFDKG